MEANEEKQTKKQRRIYIIVSFSVLLALLALGSALLAPALIRTVQNPRAFRAMILQKGIWGYALFLLIQMVQVIFAFIPGEIIEIGAGYAFGAVKGAALCLLGTLLATVPIFFLVRKFGHKLALILMDSAAVKRLSFLKKKENLTVVFFILYFLPGTPKDLFGYFAGLTPIPPLRFFLICTLGRLPSVLSSTFVGSTLADRNITASLIIFGVTGALSVLGYLVYRFISRKREEKVKTPDEEKR